VSGKNGTRPVPKPVADSPDNNGRPASLKGTIVLGSFLIFLREGIEGSMIITIMCTLLAATGRRDLFRWVFGGVGAALLLSGAAGVALFALSRSAFIESAAQTWFETAVFLLAVVILTYMTFWMKRNSRGMRSALQAQVTAAVAGRSAWPLALLAFVTVGREAIETVIFLLAIALQSSVPALIGGAVLGLAASMALSVAIYRIGVRIDFKRFFSVVGAALLVVAAGLLANAVRNLQELHVLPGDGHVLWDANAVLSDASALGDILHGLVGYAAAPTALQVATWALFLTLGLAAFFAGSGRRVGPGGTAAA
jgi:high-affinity iron transporter